MNIFQKVLNRIRRIKATNFNSHVRIKEGYIVCNKKTKLILSKGAVINLKGKLTLNANEMTYYNGRSSILRMEENSQLNVNGNFSFFYGADVILFPMAKLNLGNSFINSDCKIRCHDEISIGNDCVISHDFTIMDSDVHSLEGSRNTKPVIIGDHVWIGTRVTVLSGVTIGEGAVIGAGSVVKDDIPPRCLAVGVPARVVKENVKWEA